MTRPRWPLALTLFALVLLASTTAAARSQLAGPFFYRFGDPSAPAAFIAHAEPAHGWTRVASLLEVPHSGDGPLWIVSRLPDALGAKPTLHIPRVYLRFDAWVDGEKVASDHAIDAGGRAFHIVELRPSQAGAWLTLRVDSDYSKTGVRGHLHVGTHAEHLRAMLRGDVPRLVLVLVLLLGAIAALAFAFRNEERAAYLGYAVWSFGAAAWVVFYTRVRDLFGVDPGIWIAVWGAGLALAPIGFLLFLRKLFVRDERSVTIVLWILVGSSVAGVASLISRAPTSITNPLLQLHRFLIAGTFLLIAFVMLRRVREGDRDARVLAIGLAVYVAVGIRDVLVGMGLIRDFDTLTHWGMAAMLASGGWILRRRVADLRRQLDRFAVTVAATAQEREMMLRDLHDGLGRITTGIGMLAEVARRDRDRDEPLATIGVLAREGSNEIRTFMRGLDDEERDWPSLEAAMRERATHLVEALDGGFELSCDIAEGVEQPSAYLYIHLLRVLEEGVTNALKHAKTPTIRVRLAVDEKRVELRIENDGIHDSTHARGGVGLGAGLSNMKARAKVLGGHLDFERNAARDWARLELTIPLPIAYPKS